MPQPQTAANYPSRQQVKIWLGFSLGFALVYGILVWRQAFSGDYIVQDDARQHVFWMQRFLDPGLFPNDLIANYFESVAPVGYTWFYRLAAGLGINPLLFSKLLPPLLGLLSTLACFGVVMQIFPLPVAGFVASLLLNQMLWMNDDLISATPRAFIYPLFLGFCYFLLRRSLLGTVIMLVLQGTFYPQSVLLSAGLLPLQLVQWRNGRPALSKLVKDYWFCGIGLLVSLLVLLPFALSLSQFGPVIKVAEAHLMPEFQRGGRSDFFSNNAWKFWVEGLRSGLLPYMSRLPPLLLLSVLLPLMLAFPKRFPLVQKLQPGALLMPQIMVVSLFWFLAAHALLFRLHLPSRYTQHTFRILLCWAAAIAMVALVDGLKQWAAAKPGWLRSSLAIGAAAGLSAALIFYPSYQPAFPRTQYVRGTQPDLYHFLAQQPKDTLVASLSEEASNLPSFSQRSVLTAKEYAIPYHMGYYNQLQRRTLDLVQAQYSLGLPKLKQFIRTYGVDFWLLDRQAFTPEYFDQSWFKQYPTAVRPAKRHLKSGKELALAKVAQTCAVFQNQDVVLLEAACLLKQSGQPPS